MSLLELLRRFLDDVHRIRELMEDAKKMFGPHPTDPRWKPWK